MEMNKKVSLVSVFPRPRGIKSYSINARHNAIKTLSSLRLCQRWGRTQLNRRLCASRL